MANVLLSLWIALIGADRIDLAGGAAPFVLTPFLTLTPFVLLSELWRRRRMHRPLTIPRGGALYATFAGLMLSMVLGSVLIAADMKISASRAALMSVMIVATFAIALSTSDRPGAARALARGAAASLILFVVFDVTEALHWIGRAPETVRFGSVLVKFGDLQNAGPIPRLAGPEGDANRAGFTLIVYGMLIATGETNRALRRVALTAVVLLLMATISRSAALGAIGAAATLFLTRRRLLNPPVLVAAGVAVCATIAFFFAQPRVFSAVADAVTSPIVQRVSANEGSAQSHLALLERGIDEATSSIPRALIGLGFGNSHLVLQDVFPGNKYGNFHSFYVSIFAESGIFALIFFLVLLLVPLFGGSAWRAVIVGAVLFNVFYQTTMEPAFWFALASAWMTLPSWRPAPARLSSTPAVSMA